MGSRPFYTRDPRFAFLRRLVEELADLDYDQSDLRRIFDAVDKCCSKHLRIEDRGGWFSPSMLGGASVNHTPPHILFAVYAIYLDLVAGSPEPVSFLAHPLNMDDATAVQLDPTEGFLVESRDREAAPMTDFLCIPAKIIKEQWTHDLYGTPSLNGNVIRFAWNAAAESCPTAICSGYLFLHQESKRILNPLAISFTTDEERMFFREPIRSSRLSNYRERLVGLSGTPADVLERNHDNAKRVLEAYLAM